MPETYSFERGYVIYPEAEAPDRSAKAPFRPVPTGLVAPQRYYSAEEAELENEKLWPRVWCWAGMTHDLENVGDYFRYNLGRETFIIVRSAEDRIQAFYNVCPHRANYLVYDDFGKIDPGASIYCKFHGWRFNLDGSVREVKDEHTFPPETLCGMKGLKEVRCEVWNSMVFINQDLDAPSLEVSLDVVASHLANRDFSRMRIYDEVCGVIDANWKTAIEAFIEFYHSDDTHPQVIPITSTLKTQYDLYDRGTSRMIIPTGYSGDRAKNPQVVTDALKGFVAFFGGNNDDYAHLGGADYRIALADTLRKWAVRNGHADLFDKLTDGEVTDDWNYQIFPNVTLNVFSHSVLIQSWTPHPSDPEKHIYRALSLILPVLDPEQYVMDPASFAVSAQKGWKGEVRPPQRHPASPEEWGTVLSQDVERLPLIQKGIRSRSHEGNRLSMSECRIHHYLAEIDRYLGK